MSEVLLVKLKPLAPLHLGISGELAQCDLWVRSDTLWSALLSTASLMGREGLFAPRPEGSPLRLTSAFPRWRDVLFFPQPHLEVKIEGWKGVKFISQGVLLSLLKGESIPKDSVRRIGEAYLLTREEAEGPPKYVASTQAHPANVLDRLTSASDIFQRGQLFVNVEEGCGLFFLLKLPQGMRPLAEEVLAELGRQGLGGERSSGKGAFQVEAVEVYGGPLLSLPRGGRFLTLSLFHPTQDEVADGVLEGARYDAIVRGGWVYWGGDKGRRRLRIRCLTEGSVLKDVGKEDYGQVADVTPSGFDEGKRVFRYGRAFPIFFGGEG